MGGRPLIRPGSDNNPPTTDPKGRGEAVSRTTTPGDRLRTPDRPGTNRDGEVATGTDKLPSSEIRRSVVISYWVVAPTRVHRAGNTKHLLVKSQPSSNAFLGFRE